LAQAGASGRDGSELIAAAQRVQAGGSVAPAVPEAAEARPAPPFDDSMRHVGTLDIPLALYDIYVAETDELVRLLERDFGEWRHEAGRPASGEALTAVHTLAGTSATVGFVALRDLAYSFEATLGMLAAPAPTLHPGQHDVFDTVLACVRQMLAAFARGELAPAQPDVIEQLDALRDALTAQQAAAAYGDAAPGLARELDTLFAQAYDSLVADPPLASTTPAVSPQVDEQPAATEPVDELFGLDFDDLFDAPSLAPAAPVDEPEVAPQAGPQAIERPVALPATPMPATEPVPHDELDSDLLPVFLEEAADLLPQIGNGLRQWQQNPLDTAPAQGLLRTLHTVKGSARMAGAMRIGQHTHELETQVENMVHAGTTLPAAFDELMASYDQALALYEQLVQPPQAMGDGDGDAVPASGLPAADAAVPPEARTPLVRVRADILDRLVTQAGEVSITRSRLENQMGVLKGALSDFSDHLNRLRRQLREVEMQAESQIASRMSIAGEREFDPLEFDRFTRLQELTRMMAESVNDVASFHESLSRTVDGAGEELAAQARMTRDLQRDLMRVRMVPFASLSERLFRVARQTAKETDKRVNLDIRGGAVEIDRSVLEQMAAPFEHLLRNAIVHGIEPRGLRVASGKPETGELLVQVSQQGNEVVLQFSDDGAGLDLERIRAKARLLGMAAGDAGLSDRLTDVEAAELIFAPGFSTADTLTELAGRGVGMDVVRSEAQSLGGRVAIATEAGRGVRFTIRLPLTLAVAQVVLVASAGKTYALPSNLVEQVVQVREPELAAAAEAGMLEVAGQVLPFHYLPALLGEGEAFERGLRSRSVMVLHSAGERIALQVDDVLGNREVVIKNLGPQLARVPGIAGATVLGTGDIVLILNPLALGRHAGTGRPAPAKMAGEPLPHRPTVMVVDDSLTVRRVTQRLLEREGYRVALAKDGVDALAQLPGVRPDLMLVDIEMPRMDGFDLVRHVRNDAATSAIPIIMITSRTADKHRNVALGLGVNAYFGKPYQEPVLLGAIAGLLNREMPET
ncbi:MAG: hybrid sensor histidine kinase/response regulator, partial [Massilia sp.]|nr:hybrid sensor histidine kinase/response regulator [Massilia sp.]